MNNLESEEISLHVRQQPRDGQIDTVVDFVMRPDGPGIASLGGYIEPLTS
jgi:hypothetical protein